MALVLGTNCGFVTVAPTVDPAEGLTTTVDNYATAFKDTVPADATIVTEIGFWCDSQGDAQQNWEVGIYEHNVGDDEPEAAVGRDQANTLTTGAGWKRVTGLNIDVSSYQSAPLWVTFQVDDSGTTVTFDRLNEAGIGRYTRRIASSLPDPWGATSNFNDRLVSIYAVYETAVAAKIPVFMHHYRSLREA